MWADLAAYLQIAPFPPVPDTLFWTALVLIAGALLGEAVYRGAGLPRIVGYVAVGMLIAAAGFGLAPNRIDGSVRLIVDLGLGLLLFELGSRVHLRWLRVNPALLATGVAESALAFFAVFAALRWLDLGFNVALACAALAVSGSAAVTSRVASELDAAGQVTERMITLTALNTLLAVLSYKLVVGWLYIDRAGNWVQAISQPLYTFAASVLFAIALAALVGRVARRFDLRDENSALLLLGLILLALTGARMFNASTLLVPLLAGVLLRNSSERPWVWPRHFGTAGGVLVLMLFVVVGSVWSVDAVIAGGVAALALLAARLLAKAAAVAALARWSGITQRQGLALALTLTPMSGTALMLLADLHRNHPEFAPELAAIVVTAVAIMEVLGPVLVQQSLSFAGELPSSRASGGRRS